MPGGLLGFERSLRGQIARQLGGWQQQALSLRSKAAVCPLLPITFGGPNSSTLTRKNSLVGPGPLLAVRPRVLLGFVPAGKELLRRLLVTPLHFAHVRNVFGVLVPVAEGARLQSLLEQAQVVGAFVVARVARSVDRVAGVGFVDLSSLTSELSPRSFTSTSPSTTKPFARSSTRETRESKVALRVGDG